MLRYLMAYPKKNFSYPGPSMWFSNRINWIISDVQAKNFFLIIFLASNKVLAMLGSWIGTCSVFFHSYSVSPGVRPDQYKMKILVFSIQYDFQILKYQYQYSIWRILNKYQYQYAKKTEVSVFSISILSGKKCEKTSKPSKCEKLRWT